MNLERMLIGYKPKGFQMEKSKRAYWNRLDLSIKGGHTTAVVKHWTGREDYAMHLCNTSALFQLSYWASQQLVG